MKEKSVEDVVTLGPMAQATLVFMNIEIIIFLKESLFFVYLKSIDRVLNFSAKGFFVFPPLWNSIERACHANEQYNL